MNTATREMTRRERWRIFRRGPYQFLKLRFKHRRRPVIRNGYVFWLQIGDRL